MKKALLALMGALALVVSCSKDKETPQPQIIAVTGITVSPATLPLVVGETGTLTATVAPSNVTDITVTWTTSSSAVATVADGVVTAVAPGEATITAQAGEKSSSCTVTVTAPVPPAPALVAVDLGLSVKWANMNLGAESPEDDGGYYAWGELEPKQQYGWETYKFGNVDSFSRYTTSVYVSETQDYLSFLLEQDDAAHVSLGDKWRMPTEGEWNELRKNVTWKTATGGVLAIASNGNEIFFPYAGMYYSNDGTDLYMHGREGYYWSSSLRMDACSDGRFALLPGGSVNSANRRYGLSIRPVYGDRPPMPAGHVGLNETSLDMSPADQFTLVATILPESAADKTVTWLSSMPEVATVLDGVDTAVAPGEATITAKAGDVEATCAVTVSAESSPATTTVASLKYKELPPMAVPRKGHVSFATADGDVVVVGGHTYGFALTSTAERLHNGQWESLDIANPHDGGAGITLPDGRVLICGGFSSGLGVGQSTVCDIYDPSTHTFYSAANLVESRAASSGVLTGVGNEVLLSGNWYNSDAYFELWDGTSWTSFGSKDMQMYNPFMVSDGNGIVYVFGCYSNYGGHYDPALYKVNTKDRIVETLEYAGVEGCTPWVGSNSVEPVASLTADGKLLFIGQTEDYEHPYVLMSFDPATAKFAKLIDLPSGVEGVDSFYYSPGVLVNKSRGEAYIIGGYGSGEHQSVVVINYKLSTGSQIIYHGGDFNNGFLGGSWVLLPDSGDIVFTGGSISDNFNIQNPAIIVTPFE